MKLDSLTLDELLELEDDNELDVFFKLVEIISSKELKQRVVKVVQNNDTAGVDVRRVLQDVKLLSNVIRDKIQVRKGVAWKPNKEDTLTKAIKVEEKRIKKEKESVAKREQVVARAKAAREARTIE